MHRQLHACGADILTLNAERSRRRSQSIASRSFISLRDNLLTELKAAASSALTPGTCSRIRPCPKVSPCVRAAHHV